MVTLLGSQVFTQLGKLAFHRARPEFPVYVESSYSFPSGHATVAMALYGFFAYLLIHQTASWKAKVNFFFATVLIVFIIGFSRLYLGVHYLSDVWSGYLVGALWLVIGITLSKYWEARFSREIRPKPVSQGKKVLAGLVTGCSPGLLCRLCRLLPSSTLTPGPDTGSCHHIRAPRYLPSARPDLHRVPDRRKGTPHQPSHSGPE